MKEKAREILFELVRERRDMKVYPDFVADIDYYSSCYHKGIDEETARQVLNELFKEEKISMCRTMRTDKCIIPLYDE